MRRIFNETAANDVNRHGGYKIGDFGQGGRTYTYTSTRPSHREGTSSWCHKFIFFLTCFAAAVAIYFSEKNLFLIKGVIEEAKGATFSYGNSLEVIPGKEGMLVHATTKPGNSPLIEAAPLRDSMFGMISSPDDVMMRRHTEYCQWQENQHSKTISKGFKPDYCSQITSSGNCERVSCASKGERSCRSEGQCCDWRRGDEILETQYYYTYHKAWRDHRILSLTFDSPVAYYNPQRDPAPATIYSHDTTVDLSGGGEEIGNSKTVPLRVRTKDIEESLGPWEPLFISKHNAESLSSQALAQGFTEISHQHFYSRVSKDGLENPILLAAASYLVDGIVDINHISQGSGLESLLKRAGLDWITKGTCNAGDIRVSFEARRVPNEMSVIGTQTNGVIVPRRYKNGMTKLIQAPVITGVQDLLDTVRGNTEWWTNVYRLLIVLGLCLSCGLNTWTILPQHVHTFWEKMILSLAMYCSFTPLLLLYLYRYDVKTLPFLWLCIVLALVTIWYLLFRKTRNFPSSKRKNL